MTAKRLFMSAGFLFVLGFALALPVGPAMAGVEVCDDGIDNDQDGATDCKDSDCANSPACNNNKEGICHNIGGPRDLGANCDGTGTCSFITQELGELIVPPTQFLGIIIGFNQGSAGALAAHIAHGDGPILLTFSPALHLASVGQNHRAANVECLGQRIFPQPPEPGN